MSKNIPQFWETWEKVRGPIAPPKRIITGQLSFSSDKLSSRQARVVG